MNMDFGQWILSLLISAAFQSVVSVESVDWNTGQGLFCSGLQNELTHHHDVVACRATWEGDIATQAADICKDGWELCNGEYSRTLQQISWYEATHISGCYAINASHGNGGCDSCNSNSVGAEMAAIGADCLAYQKSSASCFGKGRITASDRRVPQYTPCHHAPWITGLLCCRKGSQYPEVKVTTKITPSTAVMVGTAVSLHCEVTGPDSALITWYKNEHRIESLGGRVSVRFDQASASDSGAWKCEATYSYGKTESHPMYLRVVAWTAEDGAHGCKNSSRGKILASADGKVALCQGAWNGHVKTASKELCAKGWRVCSYKNRPYLHPILWQEVTNIDGCYAYDAASTKYYPCARCSPRNKGNRMAGIGRDCENLQTSGYSCLGEGRMDVRHATGLSNSGKNLRSCRHAEGITTGIACCKKTRKRKDRTLCKCKNGGKCSTSGKCKCPTGFSGKRCQKRVLRTRRKIEG